MAYHFEKCNNPLCNNDVYTASKRGKYCPECSKHKEREWYQAHQKKVTATKKTIQDNLQKIKDGQDFLRQYLRPGFNEEAYEVEQHCKCGNRFSFRLRFGTEIYPNCCQECKQKVMREVNDLSFVSMEKAREVIGF